MLRRLPIIFVNIPLPLFFLYPSACLVKTWSWYSWIFKILWTLPFYSENPWIIMNDFCEAVDVYLDTITVHSWVETRPLTLKAAGSLEQEETQHMIINAVASLIIRCNSGLPYSLISYLLHHTKVRLWKWKPLSLNLKDRTTEINDKSTGYLIMTSDQKKR